MNIDAYVESCWGTALPLSSGSINCTDANLMFILTVHHELTIY